MTLTLFSAGMMFVFTPLSAQKTSLKVQAYTIHAGNLGGALDALAAQSDIQLVYATDLVTGKVTHGIDGRFTPTEALKQLLLGTGLSWTTINSSTFVLLPAARARNMQAAATTTPARAQTKTLQSVNVSGSLINSIDIQTATPTFTITAADMQARGFNSITEALQNSVLATGSVQGPQVAGSFTQGAQPISLFGLAPQFTLILIDGKPLADFGRLYNGTINITSIANLPIALVDHIDIMPGGGSSIYGSQAIAGVINIVTKSHIDGGEVSLRVGHFSDGGGANQRASFAYGHDFGSLRVLGGLEFDNASPIWGYQRPFTNGGDTGYASVPSVQAGILDYGTINTFTGNALGYLNPPGGCANALFDGSTKLASDHTSMLPGHYCGSSRLNGYTTYSNQSRSYDSIMKMTYRASDNVRIYSDAMLNWQQQRWFPGVPAWFPDDLPQGAIEDANSGHILYPEKFFAPEEMPKGAAGQMYRQDDFLYQADLGVNGQFGESGWAWDIYYLRSGDRTTVVEPLSNKANIDGFFNGVLGPVVGVDPATGFNTYRPDYPAFFGAVTPAQYGGFTQNVNEFSNTWINDTRTTVSNVNLFALPGGDASFAGLIEAGGEAWYEPVNPLFTQGAIFEHAETGGGGRRSHAASAFELNLPLLHSLTLDLSGRYDHYALDGGSDNHKFTYKAGIEYRPIDALLFRGNYTTAFKAPDLSSLFLGPTDYYTVVTDYYQCAVAKSNDCSNDFQENVKGTSLVNRTLQPTTSQSWTLGTVWSPNGQLDVSVDYLHIAIQNEVIQQTPDLLMQQDAQCLLGQINPSSAQCEALTNLVNGQVQRAGTDGPVTGITTYFANLADEVVASIIGRATYRFHPSSIGAFSLQLDYNDMLKHDYQLAPGQPTVDRLDNPLSSSEFKSIVSGAVGWTSPDGRWTSTLYGHRYGATPNYAASNNGAGTPSSGNLHPWITFNASLRFAATPQLDVSLLINNIANKMPPPDPTFNTYPYFNNLNYNVYGREVMLQADLKFDQAVH